MRIACVMAEGRGDTDLLLADIAERLSCRGVRLCGIVQINTNRPGTHRCDMDVRVLPDGPLLRISQNLGKAARGCRLDPAALETAVARAEQILAEGADLMIINKFGKHEAEGRGFRNAIAEAAARDIPVLVGLNALNADAFHEFTAGMADRIAPDPEAVLAWALSQTGPRIAA